MKVGAFGPIIFEVSDTVIRTFKDFQRTVPARWATHDVLGSEPLGIHRAGTKNNNPASAAQRAFFGWENNRGRA